MRPAICETAQGLVMIGRGSGGLAQQVNDMRQALGGLEALCLLRLFYRTGLDEAPLRKALAKAIGDAATPVLSLVPVPDPCPEGGDVSLEGVAVRAGKPRVLRPEGGFAAGIRRGIFLFIEPRRSPLPGDLASESAAVMEELRAILTDLGAGFGDVVRMNRWYHAAGTKDEWEPSARAVARCYTEPGPIATAISLPAPLPGGRFIQIELMAMLATDGTTLPKRHSWPKGHWDWPFHLPYKHGLECAGLAFVGGQVSLDERADVIDPDDMARQVARSLGNVDRVLASFGPSRLIHLGIYSERPEGGFAGPGPAATALRAAERHAPSVVVGFDYLSYPKMRVEIEAIAELT